MFTMTPPVGRLRPSRNTVPKISTALLRPSQRPVESPRYRQRSIVPLLAKRVAAKDLPGHCASDLRVFVQLISLCMPQLPLPEKIPILKRSHHDGTQILVG